VAKSEKIPFRKKKAFRAFQRKADIAKENFLIFLYQKR